MKRTDRHAVYAITGSPDPTERVAFRVGQPTDWNTAQARYERLYSRQRGLGQPARKVRVRHDGRIYSATTFEVRAVDKHGKGLGSARHATAIIAPYRAVRSAKR